MTAMVSQCTLEQMTVMVSQCTLEQNDSNVSTLLKLSFATFSNKNSALYCQNSNTDGTVSGTRQIEHQT
jgi:hypothetical protein